MTCSELKLLLEVPANGNVDLELGQLVNHMGKKRTLYLLHLTPYTKSITFPVKTLKRQIFKNIDS